MLGSMILLALREIRRNVLRSFLTVLGIVIGVGAVISMVTLVNGVTVQVTEQVASLGHNLLMIVPGKHRGPGQSFEAPSFETKDIDAIREHIASASAVAPMASSSLVAILGNENQMTTATGSDNDFFPVTNRTIVAGRQFSDAELRAGAAVCVLGDTVKKALFGDVSPIGSDIRLGTTSFRVIGLLKVKGQSMMGNDQDDLVVIPLRTLQRRITGKQDVQRIGVSVRDNVSTDHAREAIESLLRDRRHISADEEDNFHVMDTAELAETLTSTTRGLTVLLGGVASISLLVGGIGIMNIMLVSVTERTREIGIRLAIGAVEREVLTQFLVEAVILSSLGGLLGVIGALAVSLLLSQILQVPFILNTSVILLAFSLSALIGITFGYFPARKAASLNPIDALRHE